MVQRAGKPNSLHIAQTFILSAAIRSNPGYKNHKEDFLRAVNHIKNFPKHHFKLLIPIIDTYQPDDDTLVVIFENWRSYKSLKEQIDDKKIYSEDEVLTLIR